MKKIVVFGASGDIGQYFVEYFLKTEESKKFQIIAVGTRETDYFRKFNVEYYQVDISSKEQFGRLPKDVYAVVDLAGLMPARMKGYNPYQYIDINIVGTLNILEYCRENKVDRILFSQSFGDIKDWAETEMVLKADMTPNFNYATDHTVYVMSKNFAVDLIENYHQMYGLKRFIFRLPTVYLWSSTDTYYVDGEIRRMGWRILLENAINGADIEVWGDPDRQKDMVYVKDFCQMLYKALFVERNEGYYNVGTGIGTSLKKQIEGMIQVFGTQDKKSKLIMCPEKPNAPQYIMDITPAVQELGYCPQYDYITMLEDMKKEMQVR